MKPMNNFPSMAGKNMQTLFANVEQIFAVNSEFLFMLLQIEDLKNVNAFSEAFLVMVVGV
jgi:hypothetical protein